MGGFHNAEFLNNTIHNLDNFVPKKMNLAGFFEKTII